MKIQYRTMYKLIMALLALSAALLIAGYSVLRPDISANQKEVRQSEGGVQADRRQLYDDEQ